MVDSNLLITIDGDASKLKAKYEDIQKETEHLGEGLKTVAEISAVGFATLTATVLTSLDAFKDADQASKSLTQALQNQGIYTDALKESYEGYAKSVSEVTGFTETQITQSQAVIQGYLGQMPVTEALTKSIADLAQKQGIDLPSAAKTLGQAIGEGTGRLRTMGLTFAETDTETERYSKTVEFMTQNFGGMAAAANTGLGSMRGLTAAFEESQVELGQRFAPAATAAIQALTNFLKPAKDSTGAMVDLKAGLITVGLVITGLGIALPLAAQGFLAVRAAAVALEIGIAPLLLIPAAIALLAVGIVELALHWTTVTATIKEVVSSMVSFISTAFSGLSKVIYGAFHLDPSVINEGLDKIKDAFSSHEKAVTAVAVSETEKRELEQDAVKKRFADARAARQKADEAARMQLQKATDDSIIMEMDGSSAEAVALKKQEVQELTQLIKTKNEAEKALLRKEIAETQALENNQFIQDAERRTTYDELEIAAKQRMADQSIKIDTQLTAKEKAAVFSKVKTVEEVQKEAYTKELQTQIAANNTFLEEQNQYGIAYATINQMIHSAEVEGSEKAFGELSAMQSSQNATLKAIGKGAAIANIVIKTAESAMNIYAGFSAIPFIGPALGVAGAAAAIAYGGEQITNVTAANTGGVIGGIGNIDNQLLLATPGELVVPKQNFNETVNAVANQRNGDSQPGQTSGMATVQLQLKGNLMDFIEAELIKRKYLNISIQGSR